MQNSLDELSHALFVPDLYRWVKERSSTPLKFPSAGSRHIILGYTDPDLDVYIYSNIPLYSNPELRHYGFLERGLVEHSLVVLRLNQGFLATVGIFVTPNPRKTTSTFTYDIMRFVGNVAVVEKIPTKAFRYESNRIPPEHMRFDDIRHLLDNCKLISVTSPYGENRQVIFHRGSDKGVPESRSTVLDIASRIISDANLELQNFIDIQQFARLGREYTPEEVNLIAKLVSGNIKNKTVEGAEKAIYVNGEFQGKL